MHKQVLQCIIFIFSCRPLAAAQPQKLILISWFLFLCILPKTCIFVYHSIAWHQPIGNPEVHALALRFLYNRLALVIHCDSHLSSISALATFECNKSCIILSNIELRMQIPYGHAFWSVSMVVRRSLVRVQLSAFIFHLISQFK